MEKLTPEQRAAVAKSGASTRWAIYRKATGQTLKPGDTELLRALTKSLGKAELDRRIEAVQDAARRKSE